MTEDAQLVLETSTAWGLLAQIPLRISVEVGSVSRTMSELLAMDSGSVLELDRAIDDPIDILANGKVIAKGEIVNVGDRFGVRVCEIVDSDPQHAARERRG